MTRTKHYGVPFLHAGGPNSPQAVAAWRKYVQSVRADREEDGALIARWQRLGRQHQKVKRRIDRLKPQPNPKRDEAHREEEHLWRQYERAWKEIERRGLAEFASKLYRL